MKDYDVLETMSRYGGGFVQALARCYRAADMDNRKRLREAFAAEFDRYKQMTDELERQEAERGRAHHG